VPTGPGSAARHGHAFEPAGTQPLIDHESATSCHLNPRHPAPLRNRRERARLGDYGVLNVLGIGGMGKINQQLRAELSLYRRKLFGQSSERHVEDDVQLRCSGLADQELLGNHGPLGVWVDFRERGF